MTMKQKITKSFSFILVVCLMLNVFITHASAAIVPENDVVMPVGNGFVELSQYVNHVQDDIYEVTMGVQPYMTPDGADFVFLVDANENMFNQTVSTTETYFYSALDSVYKASQVLLDSTYNPMQEAGTLRNRVWVVFYNGQAYDVDGRTLDTGTTSNAICFISDDAIANPTIRKTNQKGLEPPTYNTLQDMKTIFDGMKAGSTGQIKIEEGILIPQKHRFQPTINAIRL